MDINIDLTSEQRQEIANPLSAPLADSCPLYLKAHDQH